MPSVKVNEDTLGCFRTGDDRPYGTRLVASANSDGEGAERKAVGVGTLATQSGAGGRHALRPVTAPRAQSRRFPHFEGKVKTPELLLTFSYLGL